MFCVLPRIFEAVDGDSSFFVLDSWALGGCSVGSIVPCPGLSRDLQGLFVGFFCPGPLGAVLCFFLDF